MAAARFILVGAGFTGRIVAREYARSGRLAELVAFVDDDASLHGTEVEHVRVLGGVESLPGLVHALGATHVVVTIPSLTGPRLREIVNTCQEADVAVRTMPSIIELLGQSVSARLARPVHVADLLRRAQVDCDQAPEPYLDGASVLITGAGGSIGAELARQVVRGRPSRLILLGHGENSIHDIRSQLQLSMPGVPATAAIVDIRDAAAVRRAFDAARPTVVFHAAAHKHVPLMEAHADEAVRNNVLGTRVVVDAAVSTGVERFVLISTDKAVQPASVMGATKRVAEWLVHDAARRTGRRFVTVRFGNVLGSRGSLVPVLERQIAGGGPITITDPRMRRFFLTIPEAVFLVLRAGGLAEPGRLFVLNMGDAIPVVGLAHDLMRLAGHQPGDLPIVYTGLRPGEKLDEVLYEPGSEVSRVAADIFEVREPGPMPAGPSLHGYVDELIDAARAAKTEVVERLLRQSMSGGLD